MTADFIPRLPEGQMWCRECGYSMHVGAICTRCGWCESAVPPAPAVTRDELARIFEPDGFAPGGQVYVDWDERLETAYRYADRLLAHHDIRLRPTEGSDT